MSGLGKLLQRLELHPAFLGSSRAHVGRATRAMLDTIKELVKEDGAVTLRNFGSFEKRTIAARRGYNVSTKSFEQFPEKTSVGFKPSKAWKDEVN